MLHGTRTNGNSNKKLKGVRRRKWGKWVSEIRVPGTQERLWLGTYATPEAAAVAHDVSVYFLRRPSTLEKLNFPEISSSYCVQPRQMRDDMSPRSVQRVASDAGMDVDARNINAGLSEETGHVTENKETGDDDHVHNAPASSSHDHSEADIVFWWDGLLGDDLSNCGTWQGTQGCREGEALSISIEDYL